MAVKVTHSTPADGTFSATGAAAWDADHTLSGVGTMAEQNANNVSITGGSISGVTGVATSGANSNITSLTGLTTPLSVAQGGSGTATPSLVAGTNVSISGSWPNQTVNATVPATSLTIGTTATSGGAAGQIMFDTGSVLQESSNLTWDNTNNVLKLVGATKTGVTLSGVSITGTAGQFSCSAASVPLVVGQLLTISGTFGGTGSITGYTNPTNYYISATNGSTTFTLVTNAGAGIVTTAGTPTGLTYSYDPYPLQNLTQTWNSSATAFSGLKFNVTDTASNANSLLMDLQVGGVSKFNISKGGGVSAGGLSTTGYILSLASISPTANGVFMYGGGTPSLTLSSNGRVNWTASNYQDGINVYLYRPFSFAIGCNGTFLATTFTINGDTLLSRKAAANWVLGAADAAAPVAQTLSVQSVVAGTSNTAGANLTITGSQGTGTGAGGSIIFQVAPAGTSGTAQNALSTALTLAPSASGGGIITHAAGTLADGANAYSLTATMPAVAAVANQGVNYTLTGAGSSAQTQTAMRVLFNAGYTGSGITAGLNVVNSNAGTDVTYAAGSATSAYRIGGNRGGAYTSAVSASGINTGIIGLSASSTTANYGVWGSATFAVNSSWNVGVAGFGLNTGTGTQQVGGFFALYDGGTSAPNLISAALVADNGSTSSPVFLARVAAATKFQVGSTGLVSFGDATSSFPALKRSNTILQARLADDSAYAPVEASTVRTATAYTVATLPAAGTAGRRAYVTDATSPTFMGTLTGGGSVVTPVFDNGTAWVAA